jgi:hypothetical protein
MAHISVVFGNLEITFIGLGFEISTDQQSGGDI